MKASFVGSSTTVAVQILVSLFLLVGELKCTTNKTTSNGVNRNFIYIQQGSGRQANQNQNNNHHSHHIHHSHDNGQQSNNNINNNNNNSKHSLYLINNNQEADNLEPKLEADVSLTSGRSMDGAENQQIFINQSNNIYIIAKYGQTVSLPCVIYKEKNQDLSNVHAIWHRLYDKQRPIVLSIGIQQLKQDMRYRVKVANLNRVKSGAAGASMYEEPLVYNDVVALDAVESVDHIRKRDDSAHESSSTSTTREHVDASSATAATNAYLIQNWQFEIRKLTYDDAGTYQCLLPLVKPISKNITLQVIPDLTIEPKEGDFKLDDKVIIKCKVTVKPTIMKGPNQHLIHQRHPKPSIFWYKENDALKSNPSDARKIEIDTKYENSEQVLASYLIIYNARYEDTGKYRCTYDNMQEQVNVKVNNDFFEYKNYLTSSASVINTTTRRLVSISFVLIFILSIF